MGRKKLAKKERVEELQDTKPIESDEVSVEVEEQESVEVGATWKLQTTDPEKTAKQFKADTGHELQMVYISDNVYQVTIL